MLWYVQSFKKTSRNFDDRLYFTNKVEETKTKMFFLRVLDIEYWQYPKNISKRFSIIFSLR